MTLNEVMKDKLKQYVQDPTKEASFVNYCSNNIIIILSLAPTHQDEGIIDFKIILLARVINIDDQYKLW